MKNGGPVAPLALSTKKDCRSKDALKCFHKAAVLRTALLHSKSVEQFGRAVESDCLAFLFNGKSCKENGARPVLPPRATRNWDARYLKQKVSISAFCQCRCKNPHNAG